MMDVGGNNCSYKTCKDPVKMSPSTNQHPLFTGRMSFLLPNQQCQSTEVSVFTAEDKRLHTISTCIYCKRPACHLWICNLTTLASIRWMRDELIIALHLKWISDSLNQIPNQWRDIHSVIYLLTQRLVIFYLKCATYKSTYLLTYLLNSNCKQVHHKTTL